MAQPRIGAQASKLAKDLVLNGPSGTTIPRLVYGTAWKKDRTEDLVYAALQNGFRGIDTAAQPKHYNEHGVGTAVRRAVSDGIVKREDVFIQTKITPPGGHNHLAPYDFDAPLQEKVHQSVQSSLSNFTIEGQEPYLDSLVMHSPWNTLEETLVVLDTLGTYVPHKIRNLGMSNTPLPMFQQVCSRANTTPAIIQNNFHRSTAYETQLRAFARERGIVYQSFWTYSGNKNLAQSEPARSVAEKAGVDAVVAYYALVLGLESLTILDGTTSEAHMKEDLEGIEKVGLWAEGDGSGSWAAALAGFKTLIGDA